MKPILSLALCGLLALYCARIALAEGSVPPGAAELGYIRCLINERPAPADIGPGKNGPYKWFSGQWYNGTPPSLDHYTLQDGVLAIQQGGDLVSVPRDFSPSVLPPLPGAKGFYVEFDVQLSGNDPDYFPAVWLMPVEHSGKQEDQYPGDPKGFERWMELDVDEGGFGPGLTGTVHSWTDIYPHYKHIQNPNNVSKVPIDRSQVHTFGASYDPKKQRVTWWVDGIKQHYAEAPYVPAVGAQQNFYLIMSAQSHKEKKPYTMYIRGVRAFTLPDPAPGPAAPAAK